MKTKSDFNWKDGDVARVKEGWCREGTTFKVLGPAVFQEQWWVPINDLEKEDPTYFKEAGLEKIGEETNRTCKDCKHWAEDNFFLGSICSRCKNRNNHEKLELKKYVPTSLRTYYQNNVMKEPREVTYVSGQLSTDGNEIGFWNGPNPDLTEMLEIVGKDEDSVIIRFNADWTDIVIYRWEDSDEPGWVCIEGENNEYQITG